MRKSSDSSRLKSLLCSTLFIVVMQLQLQYRLLSYISTGATEDLEGEYAIKIAVSSYPTFKKKITLILQLRGEFGNNLQLLVRAYIFKWWFEDKYPDIEIDILGQHRQDRKWNQSRQMFQQCLVNLYDFEFEGGIWDEQFHQIHNAQKELLGKEQVKLHLWYHDDSIGCSNDEECRLQGVLFLVQTLAAMPDTLSTAPLTNRGRYSLPFFTMNAEASSLTFKSLLSLSDTEITKVRELLTYNYSSSDCCLSSPDPDETVFHLRNFVTEQINLMDKRGGADFHEITPDQIVAFLNLKAGDKLAILGRNIDSPYAQKFVHAFDGTGVQVRTIQDQSPLQDFCFMLQTKKELIAPIKSTFSTSAGMIANIPLTVYSISPTVPYNGTNMISLSHHPRHNDSNAPFARYVPNVPNGNCKIDDTWKTCSSTTIL